MTGIVDQADAIQDSLGQVSEMVRVLFGELGIERVLSVDDSWELDAEGAASVAARLFDDRDLLVEVVRLLREFHDDLLESVDFDDPQAVADFLNRDWSSLHSDFRSGAMDATRVSTVDGEAIAADRQGASEPGGFVRLKELFDSFTKFETLGLAAWRKLFDEVAATEAGALVLFDRDFSTESGGTTSTGEDLVGDLLKMNNPMVRVAMLTRSVETEDQELEETRKLEEKLEVAPGRVVVVGKYRLGELDALPGALRVMLLAEQIEAYRALAERALTSAVESAKRELKGLQRYTIMGAIASGQKEGSFELDPPLRLVRRAYDQALRIHVRDADFSTSHLLAFRSGASEKYLATGDAGPQLWRVLRADLFEDGDFINSLGLPIELGDIFETSWLLPGGPSPRKYILLGQACDISVRLAGERAPEIQSFVLNEFRSVGAGHDVRDGYLERLQAIGPYEDDLEPWGVNLGSQVSVPALALDATVFRVDGEALLDTRYSENRPMAQGWLNRHAEVKRQGGALIMNYKKLLGGLGKNPQNAALQHLMAGVLGTSTSGKVGISAIIDVEQETIRYGLRRVGRLLPAAAAGLLATATAYHGRPAFDAPIVIDKPAGQ